MLARCLLSALAVALAASEFVQEDAPLVPPPKAGTISGKITAPGEITELHAISRVTGKEYQPAAFDKSTGQFTIADVPGDARYDLVVALAGGRQIEGIDLDFVDQRLLRLAGQRRQELGLPPEPPREFTAADAKDILKFTADLKDFMEIRRVLYLSGQGRRATVLVELLRAREFHAAKPGEVIWRVELWYFEHLYGGWQRLANQERVLRRERLPAEQWARISVEYYPQLSVVVRPDGTSEPVEFTIPEKVDPSRGRPAGSDVELKTPPHIVGLDHPAPTGMAPSSATRPAMP